MYFLEPIPGNNLEYLLYNLQEETITKKKKTEPLPSNTYGFDLYKLHSLFREDLSYILDIQSLAGLTLNRKDTIEELFDPEFSSEFVKYKEKVSAHIKSYLSCKISIINFGLEKIIPSDILQKYFHEKLLCIKQFLKSNSFDSRVIDFYQQSYDELKSIIRLQKNIVLVDNKPSRFYYNVFGSKNSRLSIRKNSTNVFNLPKEKRDIIRAPQGYTFCQIDFKNFQPRLAMAIFGDENIKEELRKSHDLYMLFEGDREVNKIELISWMFSHRKNDKFEKKLECIKKARQKLHIESKTGVVVNDFGRPLFFNGEEENVVFQNYICSVETDCILSLILESECQLKDSKTYLAFPFHDCLVFCVSDDDLNEINDLKYFTENYLYRYFGLKFPTSVKLGKNFGSLVDYA